MVNQGGNTSLRHGRVKEGRRPHGGLGMVTHLLRYLGGLQDALPQKSEASPAIALALQELQPGDLPFHGALTPRQREPGGDGGQVLLEPPCEADEGVDPALGGLGYPGLQRLAPASPHERQKRRGQRVGVGDGGVPLAELLHIGPSLLRPGGVGAHPGA